MVSGFNRARTRVLIGAAGLAIMGGGTFGLLAGPASANTFNNAQCHGTLNGTPLPDALVGTQNITADVVMPTEVNAGQQFTVTFEGTTANLPAAQSGFTIDNFTNLSNSYRVDGATFVAGSAAAGGVPTINGTPITGTVEFPTIHTIKSATPGPIVPGTLVTPDLTAKITAGAAGSTVTLHAVEITTTANLHNVGAAAVTCPLPDDALGTTQVVSPPPPGAPNAVADVAKTGQDSAVTVNVLENDVKNPEIDLDPDSVAVVSDPKHGTATVNADHTITYTPAKGFNGTDEFDYQLCSLSPQIEAPTAQQVEASCDTAPVKVTIAAPVVVQATTTTAAPATTTTVAQLPRTGSSSTPLALLGFGLCVTGFAALGVAKPRRSAHAA